MNPTIKSRKSRTANETYLYQQTKREVLIGDPLPACLRRSRIRK
jgi:hypothetical protein